MSSNNYLIEHKNVELSIALWNQLLNLVRNGYNANGFRFAAHGRYEYFYYSLQPRSFDSSELHRLRAMPWLLNNAGEFCSANVIERNELSAEYDTASAEALELIRYLEIKNETLNSQNNGEYEDNLTEEQRAKIAFADMFADISLDELEAAAAQIRAKKLNDRLTYGVDDLTEDDTDADTPEENLSVTRIVKDIEKRTKKQIKQPEETADSTAQETDDEDDFIKPSVDFNKKIEQALQKSTKEVAKLVQLEELTKRAIESERYTFGWFKALLELESLNSVENNAYSREVSIGFAKVEKELGTTRTLILKHPNRYIPQSMEDLADIPLVLYFRNSSTKTIAIEVVSVKSYTLRAKLKTNADIEGVDLSLVRDRATAYENHLTPTILRA